MQNQGVLIDARIVVSADLAWIHRLIVVAVWSRVDRAFGVAWLLASRARAVEAVAWRVIGGGLACRGRGVPAVIVVVGAVGGSGRPGHGSEALDGCEKLVFPGPAGGHPECHGAGGARDPAWDGEQPAA